MSLYSTQEIERFDLEAIHQQSILALGDAHADAKRFTNSIAVFEKYLRVYPKGDAISYATNKVAWARRELNRTGSRKQRIVMLVSFTALILFPIVILLIRGKINRKGDEETLKNQS